MSATKAIDALSDRLRSLHWTPAKTSPEATLWRHRSGATLAIPNSLTPGSADWEWTMRRLDAVHGGRYDLVDGEVRPVQYDVTEFSAVGEMSHDSIPFESGRALIESTASILRSSATTSRSPKAHIAGSYSSAGDRIARSARMGFTRSGSYLLPVLVPLTEPEPDERGHAELDRFESEERRMTRTMAQALTAIQTRIVDPDREPTVDDVRDLVVAGVAQETVTAVARVVSAPAVSGLRVGFRWANLPGATKPPSVPEMLWIPNEAATLLQNAATRMRLAPRRREERISGPIVEMRRVPGDFIGDVWIRSVRRGRPCEVIVTLFGDALASAHGWFESGETILVDGHVESAPGRSLRIRNPLSVRTLRESVLFPPGSS